MAYIEFKNVIKEYKMGEITIKALDDTNFEIEKGELVVIVGPSGAGKTTTLNILGGMDSATSGLVLVDGKNVTKLKNKELIQYRRNDIGFVFQFPFYRFFALFLIIVLYIYPFSNSLINVILMCSTQHQC